jgi:hypothetical protein
LRPFAERDDLRAEVIPSAAIFFEELQSWRLTVVSGVVFGALLRKPFFAIAGRTLPEKIIR